MERAAEWVSAPIEASAHLCWSTGKMQNGQLVRVSGGGFHSGASAGRASARRAILRPMYICTAGERGARSSVPRDRSPRSSTLYLRLCRQPPHAADCCSQQEARAGEGETTYSHLCNIMPIYISLAHPSIHATLGPSFRSYIRSNISIRWLFSRRRRPVNGAISSRLPTDVSSRCRGSGLIASGDAPAQAPEMLHVSIPNSKSERTLTQN